MPSCHQRSPLLPPLLLPLPLRSEISARRKSQVGTGSRSEKIKTYNYKDTRMSGEGGARFCSPSRRGAGKPCLIVADSCRRGGLLTGVVPPTRLRHMHMSCADHRSKVNYDLNKVMEGGIEESIQSLILLDQQEMLKELMEQ